MTELTMSQFASKDDLIVALQEQFALKDKQLKELARLITDLVRDGYIGLEDLDSEELKVYELAKHLTNETSHEDK